MSKKRMPEVVVDFCQPFYVMNYASSFLERTPAQKKRLIKDGYIDRLLGKLIRVHNSAMTFKFKQEADPKLAEKIAECYIIKSRLQSIVVKSRKIRISFSSSGNVLVSSGQWPYMDFDPEIITNIDEKLLELRTELGFRKWKRYCEKVRAQEARRIWKENNACS